MTAPVAKPLVDDDLAPVNQTTLAGVKRAILAITPKNTTPDQMRAAIVFMDGIKARVKELAAMFESAEIEWIQANGDIELGTIRHYVGTTTVKKCRDVRATTEAVITAAAGDLDLFASCLTSSPFKTGATESLLGEGFAAHFDKIVTTDIKTGKPKRSVKKADGRFLKQPDQEQDDAEV